MMLKKERLWTSIGLAATLIFLGLLLGHSAHYMPFLSDDSLISLRYADRLIHGQGLTWTDGRPVEGYSNLLWLLLVALLGFLGMDLIIASRLLGLLFMSLVIIFAAIRYLRAGPRPSALLGYSAGMLFFVGAAPTAVWAIGGLEQPLVAAAVAGSIVMFWNAAERGYEVRSSAYALSITLGVLCLTRPDGPLFTVAVVASSLMSALITTVKWRQLFAFIMVAVAMPVLSYLGQLIFRLTYYGEWVPNTALVKLTPSLHHLAGGLSYVCKGFLALLPGSLLAILFLGIGLFFTESRRRFVLLSTMLFLWLAYVVVIGGDILPSYRHLVPVIVLMTYAIAEGAMILWERIDGGWIRRGVFGAIVIGLITMAVPVQWKNPEYRKAITERWEWNGKSLALTLQAAFSEKRPLLAVTAAGCLPYWSRFPCLDMLGLNDYYLPRHRPQGVGKGYLGHELGDGEYVLRSGPDIIVFNAGTEPMFHAGKELMAKEEFHRKYARMPLLTAYPPEYTALVWFGKDSGRIGWLREGNRLTIPAYFLNAFATTRAFLIQGRVVVAVDVQNPVGIDLEDLPVDSDVTVVGPNPREVEYTLEPRGEQTRIVLTTKGSTPVLVESIMITQHGSPPAGIGPIR
jgi:arabinofuranosyltransferase